MADGRRRGKTTSGYGEALSSPSPRRQWRTEKNRETGFEVICDAPTTLAVIGTDESVSEVLLAGTYPRSEVGGGGREG